MGDDEESSSSIEDFDPRNYDVGLGTHTDSLEDPNATIDLTNESSSDDESNGPEDLVVSSGSENGDASEISISSSDDSSDDSFTNDTITIFENMKQYPNLFTYEDYVDYADKIIEGMDLMEIRKIYGLFSEIHVIDSECWIKYLNIEMKLAHSVLEVNNVIRIFQRALTDFYDDNIYYMYANFLTYVKDPLPIWIEILNTIGYSPKHTRGIYNMYRNYIKNCSSFSDKDKNVKLFESYIDQLKKPHEFLTDFYNEFCETFKNFELEDTNWEYIKHIYEASLKKYNQHIAGYEQEIYFSEGNFDAYYNYVSNSYGHIDIHLHQVVFERFVAKHCLDNRSWEAYLDFLEAREFNEQQYSFADIPLYKQTYLDVSNRALRCCSYAANLYIKRLQYIEKHGSPNGEKIKDVLERALSFPLDYNTVYLIWVEYLNSLRRLTNFRNENECTTLRNSFRLAVTSLKQQYGAEHIDLQELLKTWGLLEYGQLENPAAARDIWEGILNCDENLYNTPLWMEYITLETRWDLGYARRLYKKAFTIQKYETAHAISSAWKIFERVHGSLKTNTLCENYIQQEMQVKYALYEPKQGQKREASKKNTSPSKRAKLEKNAEALTSSNVESSDHISAFDRSKDNLRVFLKNIDYDVTEAEIFEFFQNLEVERVDLIRTNTGKSRGFGYVTFLDELSVQKAIARDNELMKGRPLFISPILREKEQQKAFKFSDGREITKIFIKNLSNDTRKTDLEHAFGTFGVLKDIRMVYHKNGKFKNIAFIEYEKPEEANKAIMSLNGVTLKGQQISVSISEPPPRKPEVANDEGLATTSKKARMGVPTIKAPTQQKPKLSLIPTVVRNQIRESNNQEDIFPNIPATPNNGSKSNEDFRNLFINSKKK